jgi:hypothetical protein
MYQNPELNIEQEVFDLLFTDKDCSPIKTPYILKKYRRREDNNNRIECVCFLNNKFKEGIKDCPYCYGDGYLFDEFIIEGFMYFRQRAFFSIFGRNSSSRVQRQSSIFQNFK